MTEPASDLDARKAALLFLGLLALLGLPCQLALAAAGPASAGWAPVVGTLVPYLALAGTIWIRDSRVPDPGLALPGWEPLAIAYAMGLVIAGAVWLVAAELAPMIPRVPWEAAEPFGGVVPMVLVYLGLGFLVLVARAAVEELAWRGLFLGCLRRMGWPAAGPAQALVYALWRFPLVLAVLGARPDPVPVSPGCLAVNLVAMGLLLGRERDFSGSVWPGSIFKGALDLFYLNLIPLFYFMTPEAAGLVGPDSPILAWILGPLAAALLVAGRGAGDPGAPPPGATACA